MKFFVFFWCFKILTKWSNSIRETHVYNLSGLWVVCLISSSPGCCLKRMQMINPCASIPIDTNTAPVHEYKSHSQLNNFGAMKANSGAPMIRNGLSLARFLSIHC